jgi:hypothetical protein
MNKLILLGTVHRDPAGKKRLFDMLARIRPTAISLEVSPASIALRQKLGPGWIRLYKRRIKELTSDAGCSLGQMMLGSPLRGVFEYLRLPYEYRAAVEYAKTSALPVFLLDDSELAASYLNRVESEILTRENMNLLARAAKERTLAQEVDGEYSKAKNIIFNHELSNGPKVSDMEAWARREAGLSQKLRLLHQGLVRRAGHATRGRELVAGLIIAPEAVGYIPEIVDLPEDTVHVYVGGWEHLVEERSGQDLYSRLKDLEPDREICFNSGG